MSAQERVAAMEKALDTTVEVIHQLTRALDSLETHSSDIHALCEYYGSEVWFDDVDASNRGEITGKCGVLSEDAAYNAIVDLRLNALRMIDNASALLKLL